MSYKLYTDKKENFECKLHLEGASLREAKARIILEHGNLSLLYNGNITEDGKCSIPIDKLKGIMQEGAKGKMKLEVIAEDTFFDCWESDFNIETSKKIQVEVAETHDRVKPVVVVSEVKEITQEDKTVSDESTPLIKLTDMMIRKGYTIDKIMQNKKKIIPILKEFKNKTDYQGSSKKFITEVINQIRKK
tara:strand:- start:374 stop:943 length:570 start_codon:yes stop_codon:yes gene_type:complete